MLLKTSYPYTGGLFVLSVQSGAVQERYGVFFERICSSQQKLDTVFKIMYQRTASIGQPILRDLTHGIVPVSDSLVSTPGAVR